MAFLFLISLLAPDAFLADCLPDQSCKTVNTPSTSYVLCFYVEYRCQPSNKVMCFQTLKSRADSPRNVSGNFIVLFQIKS